MLVGSSTVGLSTRSSRAGGRHPGAPADFDAKQLTDTLATKIPAMKVTKGSNPNDLMGRPGGHPSKIAFSDSRVKKSDAISTDSDALDRGGSIEIYPTHDLAKKRGDYIQSIPAGGGLLGTEYDYISGGMLVRVHGNLIPAEARADEPALQEIAP
jgi:hypothetical protein